MFQVRLKELRERAGFKSQQAFADAFGVAQSTVGGWESGKREPNFATTIKLADFFHVSLDYLLDAKRTDPFSIRFRERVAAELASADAADVDAAIEHGFPYDELNEKILETHPLGLAEACDIAVKIGSSVSELLGEDEDDYYELAFGTSSSNWIPIIKKSPGTDESAPGDKKIEDIMGLISGLDDSQKVFLVALLEKVHERNQQTHPTAQVSVSSAVPESVNPGQA